MDFTTTLTPKTFNRSPQNTPENKNRFDSGSSHKVLTAKLIPFAIANFFSWRTSRSEYFECYAMHSEDKKLALSQVFAQIERCEVGNQNRIECASDYGTIYFEQTIESGENKIKVWLNDDPTNFALLEGIETLLELQNHTSEDIHNNFYEYIESGAFKPTSRTETSANFFRKNICMQEALKELGEVLLERLKGYEKVDLATQNTNTDFIRQALELPFTYPLENLNLWGQSDLHINNYFIDPEHNKIAGIDENAPRIFFDYPCTQHAIFGAHIVNSIGNEQTAISPIKTRYNIGRAVFLPPMMDRDMMAHKFKDVSTKSLVRHMSAYDFTKEEIDTACWLLRAIKFYIVEVWEKQQALGVHSITGPSEWSSPETIQGLFPQSENPGNALDS